MKSFAIFPNTYTDCFKLLSGIWKTLIAASCLVLYLIIIHLSITQNDHLFFIKYATPSPSQPVMISTIDNSPPSTNLNHIAFGIMGSIKTWPHRRGYIEAWWRPNKTRGYIYLDKPPTQDLLPWPQTAPPYRLVDNITHLLKNIKPRFEFMPRVVHGILELFREEHDENLRWIVMGDDDSIFFLDNIVDALAKYDHTKYHYLGWHSESVMPNYWVSFNQAFGGGGIVMSYPLARAMAKNLEGCLIRYADSISYTDQITMTCIADIGVNLTPHKGFHQVDLHGDLSGFLSAHPKVPLMSLHHFDLMAPIFPSMDRFQSTRHLMKAGETDQSRLLQQTICYHRQRNWTFSISWGYSTHIYERIMPRSYLQKPIATYTPWANVPDAPPFMFDTRPQSNDSCEAPHVFFLESVHRNVSASDQTITTYLRAQPRGLSACASSGGHSADSISKIQVFSPSEKRVEIDRCECCDILRVDDTTADVKFRECIMDEIIA